MSVPVRAGKTTRPDDSATTGASPDERLRDFAEAASEWFWEQDADLRFTYLSPNVEAVSGFRAADFLGKTRADTKPQGVSPTDWAQHLDDLFHRRPFRGFRFAREDREGRMRWYVTGGKPIYDAEGRFAGYRGVGREITTELESDARAREAEDRLSEAIEGMADGFVLFDKDDKLIAWNSAMAEIAGGTGRNPIGRSYRSILTRVIKVGVVKRPPEFDTDEAYVDHIMAQRGTGAIDFEMQMPNGRWIASRNRRTRGGSTVGIRVDITEAKQREAELARREARAVAAEQRLRDAIDALHDGFVIYDAEDRVVACNHALVEQMPFYGSPDAVIGRTWAELMRMGAEAGYFDDPEAKTDPDGWIARLRAGRQKHSGGIEVKTADGRIFRFASRPTREGGSVGIRTDITEVRRREAELAAREARAVAAEQRLRDAIEAMTDTFVLYDAEDRVVVCNQRYLSQIGAASLDDIRGKTYADNMRALLARGYFDDPLARSDPEAWLARRLAWRKRHDEGSDIALSDGRINRVRTRRTRDGGLLSIMSDVTEDRVREARAIAAELRLREAIESMGDGFSLRGADDKMILCNRRHIEIFGFDGIDNIRDLTWVELGRQMVERGFYADGMTIADMDAWDRQRKSESINGVHEREIHTSDGRTLVLRCRGTPDGAVVQVSSDITRERDREMRARQAEELLRDAIESLSDGFILRGADDRPAMCNRRYLEIVGLSSLDEIADLTSTELRRMLIRRGFFAEPEAEADPEAWLAMRNQQRLDALSGMTGASDVRLADGRILNVRTRSTPAGGMVTIVSDVSTERERERRERQAEILLRTAIDSIDDGFSLWGPDDRLILWNRSFDHRMRATGSALVQGVTYHDFVLQRGHEGAVDLLGRTPEEFAALATERHHRLETREVTHRDGTVILVRERALPDGGIVRLDTDITDRKRQERLVREAEQQLRTAIETLDDGFSLWDADDRLVLWNRDFEQLFAECGVSLYRGLRFSDWVQSHADSGVVDLNGATAADYTADRTAQHRRVGPREISFIDGRTLLVREQHLPEGGIVRLDIDITERKQQETLLLEAKESAEQASRAKSTFLASMSHELRTPLNAILGFSETMAKEMLGPLGSIRYVDYAGDIHTSGMLLLDLINDMLDMSRIEAGRYELRRETVRPGELAREALGVIRVQAGKGGVTLEERIDATLPAFAVDRRAVRQVLLNLLSNAVKFSHPGGVVTLEASASEGSLRFCVTDRGIGIARQDIARLARPFERVGNVMTQPIQGTGLGLSISKRLVELHGGTLTIDSEYGRGTTVTVLLPPA